MGKKTKNKLFSYPPSGPDATRAAMLEPLGLVPLLGLGLFFSPAILEKKTEEKRKRGGKKVKGERSEWTSIIVGSLSLTQKKIGPRRNRGEQKHRAPSPHLSEDKMRSLRATLRLFSRLNEHPFCCYRSALSELQKETARAHNGGRSIQLFRSRSLSTSASSPSTAESPPASSSSSSSSSSSLEPFSRLTDADVAIFKEILGSKGVITDKEALVSYNTDWTGAFVGRSRLVLRPATTQQASAALAHLNSRRLAVVPQGGNTGLVGGGVPIADEVILSTDRLTEKKKGDDASSASFRENAAVVADATAMTLVEIEHDRVGRLAGPAAGGKNGRRALHRNVPWNLRLHPYAADAAVGRRGRSPPSSRRGARGEAGRGAAPCALAPPPALLPLCGEEKSHLRRLPQ